MSMYADDTVFQSNDVDTSLEPSEYGEATKPRDWKKILRMAAIWLFAGIVVATVVMLAIYVNKYTALLAEPCYPPPKSTLGDQAASALFTDYWQATLAQDPALAAFAGRTDYNNRLPDLSPDALDSQLQEATKFYDWLNNIRTKYRSSISAGINNSLTVLEWRLSLEIEERKFHSEYLAVSPLHGPQVDLEEMMMDTVFTSSSDLDLYLQRLSSFPIYINQVIDLLRQGLATGWVYPEVVLQPVESQIQDYLNPDPTQNPFYIPFTSDKLAEIGINSSLITQYQKWGNRTINASVIPAFASLLDFWTLQYLPNISAVVIGANNLPQGNEFYQYLIKAETSSLRTADEIYQLGLSEVTRIQAEIQGVLDALNFTGTMQGLNNQLLASSDFYFDLGDDLLSWMRDFTMKLAPKLLVGFSSDALPRCPLSIEKASSEALLIDYLPPSWGCTSSAILGVNTDDLSLIPIFMLPQKIMELGIPGLHLPTSFQFDVDVSNTKVKRTKPVTVPDFIKFGRSDLAYSQGWSLYAESLGSLFEVFSDPAVHFTTLGNELADAALLVVDTGLNTRNWTLDAAVQYLSDNTLLDQVTIQDKVYSCLIFPARSLAPKIGQLAIQNLSAQAQQKLGTAYSIQDFHDVILNGSVPLTILQQRVDAWLSR